ncbi:DUF2460 domain-containing protein [Tropicimonas sp. TH_r6]|uniref:DUF2460 domain-containing protein n=1 Tax=Tropicimonas sp. TH_r6 TaxID=3082085 RepID=UPI002955A530|nr:DUF2460 domain-containing protein [Tropicimonas sp. TH_r6]MDV7145086.1 DUF2460 domain-containing protein [Tropicimonas sp. TH_r6]
MGFHEVRFPAAISFGSIGGPERKTEIVSLANGFEERNTPWAHSRRRYDAGLGLQTLDELEELISFFEARRGQLYGFRWKDWTDYKSSRPSDPVDPTDQALGTGNGAKTQFQLVKVYSSGGESYSRPISKPVEGTVRVALDGVELMQGLDWAIDTQSGTLAFVRPPGDGNTVTAGFEFDVPVRFDTDAVRISAVGFDGGEVPDVPVVEVRV